MAIIESIQCPVFMHQELWVYLKFFPSGRTELGMVGLERASVLDLSNVAVQ